MTAHKRIRLAVVIIGLWLTTLATINRTVTQQIQESASESENVLPTPTH